MTRRGITLLEVLLALILVALLAVPVFEMFSTSRKMTAGGQERLLASSLASSYVAALTGVAAEALSEAGPAKDSELRGPLTLRALGVAPCPAGFSRTASLLNLAADPAVAPMWQVTVTVEWTGAVSGAPLSFTLQRLF
ncbi:MAG: hypothetical protein HYY25_16160 [Candidatus Wallbacteria bacterium]|nr:hypothetical protein [Candidatus Wallbacteria bacterium]